MDSDSSDEDYPNRYTIPERQTLRNIAISQVYKRHSCISPMPETSGAMREELNQESQSSNENERFTSSNLRSGGSEFLKSYYAHPSTSKKLGSNFGNTPQPSTSSQSFEKPDSKDTKPPDTPTENKEKDIPFTPSGSTPWDPSFFDYFNKDSPAFKNREAEQKKYVNSEEYFRDLRLWLEQAYFWQSVTASFPYYLMCQQIGGAGASQQMPNPPGFNFPMPPFPGPFTFPTVPGMQQPRQDIPPTRREVVDGFECRIPAFWKRIIAEFIDFVILFFVKIAITYIAVDFFNFIELDTVDLFQKDMKIAYKTFMQFTQDIVILELIHRVIVCAFETFCLHGSQNGRIGGATPGKSVMGLRVLMCETTTPRREGDELVIVRPGASLGITTAFLRALTKNFVIALLIPTSFAFIFFPNNRTGYDMICGTIVVEEPLIPHRVPQT